MIAVTIVTAFGYGFIMIWNYTKFSMQWGSFGQYHVLLKSSFCGFTIFIVLLILTYIIQYFSIRIIYFYDIIYLVIPLHVTIFTTVVVGVSLPYILNLIFKKRKHLRAAIENFSDSLNLLIFDSIERGDMIELILRNSEVYIGFPIKPLNFGYQFVELIPYAVGLYSIETNSTQIISRYSVVDNESLNEPYKLSIKVEEIVTARKFDGCISFSLVRRLRRGKPSNRGSRASACLRSSI